MVAPGAAMKRLCQCRQTVRSLPARSFSTSSHTLLETSTTTSSGTPSPPPSSASPSSPANPSSNLPDPSLVFSPRSERRLLRAGIQPIGSRRRRAVLASLGSKAIPFEQLPYQCFQEARKVLLQDRQKIVSDIERQRAKLNRLREIDASKGGLKGESTKQRRIDSLVQEIEHLKILADVNDPLVKMRFEDGKGDLAKPIYRQYALKKWHKQKRLIDIQRIEQFNIVPDLLMKLEPAVDIKFNYGGAAIEGGAFLPSITTKSGPPDMTIQTFERGSRLLTVAVIDADVPDVAKDGFDFRLHYVASNITITATDPNVSLGQLDATKHVSVPWLAPWAQKGSPYHRMVVVVLEQEGALDVAALRSTFANARHGFKLRSFLDRTNTTAIGATLFRTKWDEGMDGLMKELGVLEAEMELKRKRVEPMPYVWKPRDGERYR